MEPFCTIENHGEIPGEETKEAIEEVRRMKSDPTLGKTYTDVDEMMKVLQEELETEG